VSRFAIRYPYLIVVTCLIVCVVGVTSLVRMPVDLFPPINIPVVVVATFYSGMPPEQIENDITGQFERMFTLASGIDHMESRSLTGVSLIKVYFQPGSNPDSDVTGVANLAMATLRYLPQGTLPPIVMKFDASSLPVCLVTLKGEGLSEAQLRDLGQFTVRNQMAGIPGASVPPAFGGRYRQIMVYVDPLKLEAHQLSVMDVVRSVNEANLILPAGDVKIGPYDYNIYANNQINAMKDIDLVPLKTVGEASVLVADVGKAQDASQIQYNKVRINGQASVYVPVLRQGGDANTIAIVNGVKSVISRLLYVPKRLVTQVVFDQSVFVRTAIETLVHEGTIGLVLTGLMILVFLGSLRHRGGVSLDPALGPGDLHCPGFGRQHRQRDDPGRFGPRVLPVDRQFGRGAGEYFPPPGNGRTPGGRRRTRRPGSGLARAGGHPDDGRGVLSGHFSLWRESVLVLGTGAVSRTITVRVVLCGDDGGAVVLRQLDQGPSGRRGGKPGSRNRKSSLPWLGPAFQCLVQPQVPPDARRVRRRAEPRVGASLGYRAGHHRPFPAKPGALSTDREVLLPAHRSEPIRH